MKKNTTLNSNDEIQQKERTWCARPASAEANPFWCDACGKALPAAIELQACDEPDSATVPPRALCAECAGSIDAGEQIDDVELSVLVAARRGSQEP